ncbi:MAG: hypothetical protein IT541_17355, partial [Hyphomicrobiales bacterium]|nr:hypothetical protein [Hyphomicrobiales bacterium]
EILKAADMGLLGFCPAFEMCFSVDYHGAAIPYPMDALPYELTSYAFREFSWEPAQTIDAFREKMRNRYFGLDGDMGMVDALIYLRQFAIDGGWASNRSILLTQMAGEFVNYDGKKLPAQDPATVLAAVKAYGESDRKLALDRLETRLKELKKIHSEDVPRMKAISGRIKTLEPEANPREKSTYALISRFIRETMDLLEKIGVQSGQIDARLSEVASARTPAP